MSVELALFIAKYHQSVHIYTSFLSNLFKLESWGIRAYSCHSVKGGGKPTELKLQV